MTAFTITAALAVVVYILIIAPIREYARSIKENGGKDIG